MASLSLAWLRVLTQLRIFKPISTTPSKPTEARRLISAALAAAVLPVLGTGFLEGGTEPPPPEGVPVPIPPLYFPMGCHYPLLPPCLLEVCGGRLREGAGPIKLAARVSDWLVLAVVVVFL